MLVLFLSVPNIPRPSVAFPFLLGVVSLYYFHRVEKDLGAALRGSEESWFLITLFGFCGYLFLNSFWSLTIPVALAKAVIVLSIIVVSLLVTRAISRQSPETLERTAHFAIIGAMIGTAIICFEFSTDHYLTRLIYTYIPAIRGGEKTIDVFVTTNGVLTKLPESEFRKAYDDVVITVSSSALNRNLSLLMLLLWPALLIAVNQDKPKLATLSTGFIAVASAGAIYTGYSQTAQAALLLSVAVFLIARFWPTFTHWSILSTWCVVVMLAMPIAAAPYSFGLHTYEWIPSSFRDRMIIWDYSVKQATKNPLFGVGIRSIRVIGKELKKSKPAIFEQVAYRRLGLHSHNGFLQVWFELGAVGALFILALGIGLLRAIKRMRENVRPYAYAAFVSACVNAAFGWGLWQTWLLSGYALTIMLLTFASAYTKRNRDHATQ